MRIGFDASYVVHDSTYAAMRLSESLTAMGYDTTIYSSAGIRHRYGRDWDHKVITPREMTYKAWLKTLTHIIWPTPPHKEDVHRVGKSLVTIALAPWEWLPSFSKRAFKACAHVISTCKGNTLALKHEFGLTNVSTIHWDSHLPVTRKSSNYDQSNPRILIPLHASQSLRCDLDDLFELITGITLQVPKAKVFVLYSHKGSLWEFKKDLRRFVTATPNVVMVSDTLTNTSSILLYGYADLIVWPAEIEGFGLAGIEALYMGTPVVAYDVQPMSSIIQDGINGLLVPCEQGGSKGGIRYAKPDPAKFIEVVKDVIENKLVDFSKHTRVGMASRRSKFNAAWRKVIEG